MHIEDKLYPQIFATNTRAIALYTALGFIKEGRQAVQHPVGSRQTSRSQTRLCPVITSLRSVVILCLDDAHSVAGS